MPSSTPTAAREHPHLPGNEDARLVRVLADGTLVLLLGGEEREAELFAGVLPQPPPSGYFEVLEERLPRLRQPLRCLRRATSKRGRLQVSLWCRGWQDKSGDVWIELASFL